MRELENDRYVRKVEGYLPQASVAFIDEIFKANSAILNTLLTILNERLFDNGNVRMRVPLVCMVRCCWMWFVLSYQSKAKQKKGAKAMDDNSNWERTRFQLRRLGLSTAKAGLPNESAQDHSTLRLKTTSRLWCILPILCHTVTSVNIKCVRLLPMPHQWFLGFIELRLNVLKSANRFWGSQKGRFSSL